jgi:hypothetical protein
MGKKEKESKRGLEEKLFLLLLSLGLWVLFSFEGLAVQSYWVGGATGNGHAFGSRHVDILISWRQQTIP